MSMYNLPLRSTGGAISPHVGNGNGSSSGSGGSSINIGGVTSPHVGNVNGNGSSSGSSSGGDSTIGSPRSPISDLTRGGINNSSSSSSGGSSSGSGTAAVMPMYNLSLQSISSGGNNSNGGTPRSPGNDLTRGGINNNSGSGSSSSGSGTGGVMSMYTLPLRSTNNNGNQRLWTTSGEEPPVKSPSQMYSLPVKSSSQISPKECRDNVVPVGAMYVLPPRGSNSASHLDQSNLLAPSQNSQSNLSYEARLSRVRAWVDGCISLNATSTAAVDKPLSSSSSSSFSFSSSSSSSSFSVDMYEWLRTGEVLCDLMMKLRGPDGKYTNLAHTSGEQASSHHSYSCASFHPNPVINVTLPYHCLPGPHEW